MQIQIVHYLFNIHHLRLVDFGDTDVVFGSNCESSLKNKAEIVTRIKTLMPGQDAVMHSHCSDSARF